MITIHEVCKKRGAVRLPDMKSAEMLWEIIESELSGWISSIDRQVYIDQYTNKRYARFYNGNEKCLCCGLSKSGITGIMEDRFYVSYDRPIFEITDIVNTLEIDTNAVMMLIED